MKLTELVKQWREEKGEYRPYEGEWTAYGNCALELEAYIADNQVSYRDISAEYFDPDTDTQEFHKRRWIKL